MRFSRRCGFYILMLVLVVVTAFSLIACSTDDDTEKGSDVVEIRINEFPETELYQSESLSLEGASLLVTRRDKEVYIVDITEDMVSGFDKNLLGEQTITVTYEKCITTFKVTVIQTHVQGISINKKPDTITVVQGDELSITGVSINIVSETGLIPVDVNASMVRGYSTSLGVGKHVVYIQHAGFSTPLEIEVLPKTLTKIDITTVPNKKQYFKGEVLNAGGLVVKRSYDNGTEDTIAFNDYPLDFTFEYNFNIVNAHSIVKVYVGGKLDTFECIVKDPVVSKFVVDVFPESRAIVLTDKKVYPTDKELYPAGPLMEMVQGQRINWSLGEATVYYDNGASEKVQLSSSDIFPYYNKIPTTTEEDQNYLSKEHTYDEAGEHILYVRYRNNSNTDLYAQVHITVKEKEAVELILGDTREDGLKAEDRTYIEGETFTTSFLRYNVLYDNGTYEYDIDKVGGWGSIEANMLADNGSTFNLSTSNLSTDGKQHITFIVGKVYADYKITVVANSATYISVHGPDRNVYAIGSEIDLAGSYVYVEYLNDKADKISPIPQNMITLKDASGVETSGLIMSSVGEYTATVSVGGINGEFKVNAVSQNQLVTSVIIEGYPSDSIHTFASYEDIPFDTMSLSVTRSGSTESRLFSEAEELYVEKDVKGVQSLVFRFEGYVFELNVNIIGRQISSIEISKAPKKLIYIIGEDTTLDISGLLVAQVYNDGERGEEDVFDELWSFSGYDLSVEGNQTVTVRYDVTADRYYTAQFDIEVTGVAVREIIFDETQPGIEEYTLNDETFRGIKVTYRDDINLTHSYTYLNAEGETVTEILTYQFDVIFENGRRVKRELKASYIDYDKNVNPSKLGDYKKTATINFGGKTTTFNLYVVNRTLESISVYAEPDTLIYAEGQSLNNKGGYIERRFSDGNTDILPMDSGLIAISGYAVNPFSNVYGGKYVDQTVTLTYGGKTTSFGVRTYRKLVAEPTLVKSIFFYGENSTPVVNIKESISGFTVPETTVEYLVDGSWVSTNPVYPGTYPIRINVLENEYYEGDVIENDNCKLVINKKAIILYVDALSKTYMDRDPEFSYRLEDNALVDGDVIDITMYREEGEDVKYVMKGGVKTIGYYPIYAVLEAGGNNQNGLYQLVPSEVGLTINPKTVTVNSRGDKINVDYTVPNALDLVTNTIKYTGAPIQAFSASYKDESGYTVVIEQKDILYYDEDGNLVDGLPTAIGEYEVRISDNYSFQGIYTRTFEIIQ